MSWPNAKKTADEWIEKHLSENLSGALVQVVDFPDDETCRAFYSDRDLGFHKMVTKAIARIARKRGAKILHVQVTLSDYERDPRRISKRAFIESCHRVFSS